MLRNVASDMERALGALRDFTRRDILLRFYGDRKPRSVDDVAHAAGIHRSVAFEHLERLVALGYLQVERRRGLPGKPAKIYRLTAGPVQISHPMRRYDALAEALAQSFQRLGDRGNQAIREAGRAYGAGLGRPGSRSVLAALEPLREMGGEYEVSRGGAVTCTNCLFAEVCRRTPIVCSFHAGLIGGLLERSEMEAQVEALGPRDPDGCAYAVQQPARSSAAGAPEGVA
jgi:predicted ArsR family transcriptional regulator